MTDGTPEDPDNAPSQAAHRRLHAITRTPRQRFTSGADERYSPADFAQSQQRNVLDTQTPTITPHIADRRYRVLFTLTTVGTVLGILTIGILIMRSNSLRSTSVLDATHQESHNDFDKLVDIVDPLAAAEEKKFFNSPDGNIVCLISSVGARCDVTHNMWVLQPEPENCDGTWGVGVSVTSSGAHLLCEINRVADVRSGTILGYGALKIQDNYTCVSERAGVTCLNNKTQHGFTAARGSFSLF